MKKHSILMAIWLLAMIIFSILDHNLFWAIMSIIPFIINLSQKYDNNLHSKKRETK
jgi:hypothetical protein